MSAVPPRPVLRRLLSLEQQASGKWCAIGAIWADVKPAAMATQDVTHGVIVRVAPEGSPRRPEPGQQFRDGSERYEICSVSTLEHNGQFFFCKTRKVGK
jgi:hypothetical protein